MAGPGAPATPSKKADSEAGSEHSAGHRIKTVATNADLVKDALIDCGRRAGKSVLIPGPDTVSHHCGTLRCQLIFIPRIQTPYSVWIRRYCTGQLTTNSPSAFSRICQNLKSPQNAHS